MLTPAPTDNKLFRYKIIIEYMGNGYCGWQRQDHALAIQEVIENAIKKLTKKEITLFAAGRTDTGVHAIGQVAHFDLPVYYEPYKLQGAINHFMQGHTIGIIDCQLSSKDFHARFSAKKRHYIYKIINRRAVNVIYAKHKTWVKEPLDHGKMQAGANYLIGEHDFSSFRASICQSSSAIKNMDTIKIIRNGEDIMLCFSALSFLHHMVRNIVGSLIYVGNGKWQPEKIQEILQAKDRKVCGPTAPATGLYFYKVDY